MIAQVFGKPLRLPCVKSGLWHQDGGGHSLEMQSLRPHPQTYQSDLYFSKIPCTLKFEKDFRRRELSGLGGLEESCWTFFCAEHLSKVGFSWPSAEQALRDALFLLHGSNEKGLISPSTAGAILQSRTNIKRQQARHRGQPARAVGLELLRQPERKY